ncbi:MAG: glycoside hydrolase family 127 protein [Bacteroidales bacterium]|nr:glycoside hydrolase family 127 protein [Bacteroidales bacterium]
MTFCSAEKKENAYPIEPVPFTSVRLTDNFWAPKIRTNYEVTIPIAIGQCYNTGRVDNFKIAGKLMEGKFRTELPFDDTDIYKLIEAASYSLQTIPDANLEARLDTLIYYVGMAQEPDGYLYTNRTIDSVNTHPWAGNKRWVNDPELSHELYNCGHLYEAAVAHYQATGKKTLLDIAIKNADLLLKDFGWGKLEIYPGHQVVEMGLVKLYNVTGKKEYLDLAKFFLDVRGPSGDEYNQAHQKVVEQTEPVGHAVRATYMYSGMADIAAIYNDTAYHNALMRIWETLVSQKTYITGGIGSGGGNEGFDPPYVLPNMSAYCETCASVGNIFWNQRMFLHDGDGKYYDVLERTLYNAFLSGVSLSGDRFFYPNVLESFGQHQRSAWFGCACCPPNLARLLPSLPGYFYAKTENEIYINLFASGTAAFPFRGADIEIIQKTEYPWNGKVEITLNPENQGRFTIKLRIPGWAQNEVLPGNLYTFNDGLSPEVKLTVNGKVIKTTTHKEYVEISRKWKSGDLITLELPMDVRKVIADSRVKADHGKIAVERGPIVYCAEWPYAPGGNVLNLLFDENAAFTPAFTDTMLNGVNVVKTTAQLASYNLDKELEKGEPQDITLIPYYTWNNKGAGQMAVWLPVSDSSVRPMPAPTIAAKSKVTASIPTKALMAVNDQYEPKSSIDREWPFYHMWPKNNSWEWVQYDFENPEKVSYIKVYWFDDGPFGGCRIPDEWELLYLSGGKWVPVKPTDPYKTSKDAWNELSFAPVTTKSLRLKMKLNERFSTGIHEWVVE